jgi:hypothetical protein
MTLSRSREGRRDSAFSLERKFPSLSLFFFIFGCTVLLMISWKVLLPTIVIATLLAISAALLVPTLGYYFVRRYLTCSSNHHLGCSGVKQKANAFIRLCLSLEHYVIVTVGPAHRRALDPTHQPLLSRFPPQSKANDSKASVQSSSRGLVTPARYAPPE